MLSFACKSSLLQAIQAIHCDVSGGFTEPVDRAVRPGWCWLLEMRVESWFFVLCDHLLTGVCLPCDPVIGKPLLPRAAGDHGPVSYLYPGGQAAENSLGSCNHWRPPKPKCKTKKSESSTVWAANQKQSQSFWCRQRDVSVCMYKSFVVRHSKAKQGENETFCSSQRASLVSFWGFLCLCPPLGPEG